jgi:hypothetical protein
MGRAAENFQAKAVLAEKIWQVVIILGNALLL